MASNNKKKPDSDVLDNIHAYGLDILRRRVYLSGEIDTKKADRVIKNMSVLYAADPEAPITLVINSEGGRTLDAIAMHDYIASLPVEITAQVFGLCGSAAVLVLQACRKRHASSNSVLMVHRGSRADIFDMEMDERVDRIIAGRMGEGWSQKKLDKYQVYDRYMFAEKALEMGLIDEVLP